MLELKNLVRKVNKIERQLTHHLGAAGMTTGEMPHPAADYVNAGFMTPADKLALRSANGEYTVKDNGTDVFTLPTGKYSIIGSPNRPGGDATAINSIFYDVTIKDTFKTITATLAYNGKQYFISFWGDDAGSNGWRKEVNQVTLFSGYISSGSVTLPIDIDNFDGIKFLYTFDNTTREISEHAASSMVGQYNLFAGKVSNAADSWLNFGQMQLHFTDQKNLTIDSNKTTAIDGQGHYELTDGTIAIGRIIGVIGDEY